MVKCDCKDGAICYLCAKPTCHICGQPQEKENLNKHVIECMQK